MADPNVAVWLGDIAGRLDLTEVVPAVGAGAFGRSKLRRYARRGRPCLPRRRARNGLAATGRRKYEAARRDFAAPAVSTVSLDGCSNSRGALSPAGQAAEPCRPTLAAPEVLAAAKTFAPELSAVLAVRAIPAGLRHAQRPADFTRAARPWSPRPVEGGWR
ncbi:hypothetical protein ACRAWD_27350 [Caulobacter segnis]